MSDDPNKRRQQVVRAAALFALAAGLAAIAFLVPASDTGDETLLFPDDALRQWPLASPALKRSVAAELVADMHRDETLGPRTLPRYEDPLEREKMIDELVAVLDASTDQNRPEYASPGLAIRFVATRATTHMGWRQ